VDLFCCPVGRAAIRRHDDSRTQIECTAVTVVIFLRLRLFSRPLIATKQKDQRTVMTQAVASADQDTELYNFVATTIAKELKIDELKLTPGVELRSIDGIESIKVLRIVCKVEQKYDVELQDDAVFRANTIQDIMDAVKLARAAK
jgi:acyl carrier protein